MSNQPKLAPLPADPNQKPLPCPCCNNSAVWSSESTDTSVVSGTGQHPNYGHVWCGGCGLTLKACVTRNGLTLKQEAIARWNLRRGSEAPSKPLGTPFEPPCQGYQGIPYDSAQLDRLDRDQEDVLRAGDFGAQAQPERGGGGATRAGEEGRACASESRNIHSSLFSTLLYSTPSGGGSDPLGRGFQPPSKSDFPEIVGTSPEEIREKFNRLADRLWLLQHSHARQLDDNFVRIHTHADLLVEHDKKINDLKAEAILDRLFREGLEPRLAALEGAEERLDGVASRKQLTEYTFKQSADIWELEDRVKNLESYRKACGGGEGLIPQQPFPSGVTSTPPTCPNVSLVNLLLEEVEAVPSRWSYAMKPLAQEVRWLRHELELARDEVERLGSDKAARPESGVYPADPKTYQPTLEEATRFVREFRNPNGQVLANEVDRLQRENAVLRHTNECQAEKLKREGMALDLTRQDLAGLADRRGVLEQELSCAKRGLGEARKLLRDLPQVRLGEMLCGRINQTDENIRAFLDGK